MENAAAGGGNRMNASAFQGRLVRLTVFDPDQDTQYLVRWNQDSEYQQLLSSGPTYLWPSKNMKEWMEKHFDEMVSFTIRSLEDNRVIGCVDLSGIEWTAGNAWVGIGIGERENWGKGFGSDAMNMVLRFAFETLNLKRVSLTVFDYNERAIHSYEKVGFKLEGRMRQWMQRAGQRYDLVFMGVLRNEWEELQKPTQVKMMEPI
jgi:RimJ/RimL family protein N-acetyltransferase